MNKAKTYEPVIERSHPAADEIPTGMGIQKVFRFENDYGASVVCFTMGTIRGESVGSYGVRAGLWELAVVKFNSEDNDDFNVDLSTPITNDVRGWLTDDEVNEILAQIEALPKGAE